MLTRLNFKNKRAGRKQRAAWYVRWPRLLRRKRVGYARAQAASTIQHAQRQLDRMYALARRYNVPIEDTGPMPAIPDLPGQAWVEHLQDMGDLVPPVRSSAPAGARLA